MIEAEELGVTSVNLAEMAKRDHPDVKRLLGVTPGNGKALGLDEAWAHNVVKAVGNYGEFYERNVGMGSPIKLPRGVNALSSAGGLMFAPPCDDQQHERSDQDDPRHRVGGVPVAFTPAAATSPRQPAPTSPRARPRPPFCGASCVIVAFL